MWKFEKNKVGDEKWHISLLFHAKNRQDAGHAELSLGLKIEIDIFEQCKIEE